MKPRKFSTIIGDLNEEWLSKVLKMKRGSYTGVDLYSKSKVVEVKFRMKQKNTNTYFWTINQYQTNYPAQENKKGFWALGIYELEKPVESIKSPSRSKLEALIKNRQVYIVGWNWIYQFPVHKTSGQTSFSQWENDLIYASSKNLPPIKTKIELERATINFAENVEPEYFLDILE